MDKPKKDLYKQLEPIARLYLRRKFDISVTGEENILDEPAMYVSNHVLAADSLIFASEYTQRTGTPLRFGAKMEYFDGRGIDGHGRYGKIAKWAMEHTGQLPVDRDGVDPRGFIKLQKGMQEAVERGDSVALYPEGTRNKEYHEDPRVHKFQTGAARIALALNIPIVPYAHVYTTHSNERKIQADVIIGEAITPEMYAKDPMRLLPKQLKAEYLTQAAENRVADLGGMQQSGVFALRQTIHLQGKKR